jgi:hypothetical protein
MPITRDDIFPVAFSYIIVVSLDCETLIMSKFVLEGLQQAS